MARRLTTPTLLALLAGAAAAQAGTVTLKPYTALDRAVVRLSDLFEGADDRPLGPGPAPGARILVEAPQLAAIARMFAVDWRPAGPGERAVLERPGRSLTREDLLAPLRALLEPLGAARDSDLELPGFITPPLPTGAPPSIGFSATEFDPATGRFTTLVTASADGLAPVQLRLSGRVQAMTELPVPRRALAAGEVITANDLQWMRLRAGIARGDVVRQVAQAEGQALRRPVQPGLPIAIADLGRPVVILKGAPLIVQLQSPGLELTAQAVAAEPGGLGERIRVINPYSRAVMEAEITGPGRARVLPAIRPEPRQVAAP